MKKLISICIALVALSFTLGIFIRDYTYWRYDRVCVEPITDSDMERIYDRK